MSKLKLEVGKSYRSRGGVRIDIIEKHKHGRECLYVGARYNELIPNGFKSDGKWRGRVIGVSDLDLISEWEEEPKMHLEQPMPHFSKGGINTFKNGTYTISADDKVNHPAHYTTGKVECIDAIESATTGLTGIEAVCTANAIKYLWRWKQKNGVEDLKKAQWYINNLIEKL